MGRRQWIVMAVGVVLLLGGALTGWRLFTSGSEHAGEHRERIESYQVRRDGRTLDVAFRTGACNDSERVEAEETNRRVVLTAWVNPAPGLCETSQQRARDMVELDRPLGERTVVDGVTGDPVERPDRRK